MINYTISQYLFVFHTADDLPVGPRIPGNPIPPVGPARPVGPGLPVSPLAPGFPTKPRIYKIYEKKEQPQLMVMDDIQFLF